MEDFEDRDPDEENELNGLNHIAHEKTHLRVKRVAPLVIVIGTQVFRFASRKLMTQFLARKSTINLIKNLPKTHGNLVKVPS